MRELKVEDALYYLDTVKQEFGDRPHIYNEFLDIMKKFKSQEIDTPGVIRRVSTLFHGNRRLVLGFNTFLPEGYKIELPTDENGQAYAVYRTPGQPGVTQVLGPNNTRQIISSSASSSAPQQAQVHLSQPSAAAAAIPSTQKQSINQHAQMVQQPGARPNQNFGMQSAPTGSMVQNQMQGMSQNASTIMQRSGAMALNMDGVNMNSFVPSRHLQQQQPSLAAQSSHHSSSAPMGQYAQQGQITGVNSFGNQVEGISSITHPLQQGRMGTGLQQQQHTTSVDAMQPASNVPQTNQQHPAEFDHAINYVTTIKKRFAKEPQTYKKFLDILHTYQKQQRGIKEVLDDVSTLFAEHPDLLTDFTYFLPDAVQEQAKLQLEQVAKAAEARKMAQSAKQAIMAQASMQRPHSSVTQTIQAPVQPSQPFSLGPGLTVHSNKLIGSEAAPNPVPFGATKGRPEDREREICRSSIYGFVSFDPTRPPRR
jgi:paired amphipathic helix protein Sin3a